MQENSTSSPTIMGFARYFKKEECHPELLIEACHNWKQGFLSNQQGIQKHYFFGNLAGEFADIIFAQDAKSFATMAENMQSDQSSMEFIELLQTETIKLTQNIILKSDLKIPEHFSCMEFGSFKLNKNKEVMEQDLLAASREIETDYLSQHQATVEHFIGKIETDTYSEITFYKTLAEARKICSGYIGNPSCEKLLNLIEPETTDLNFWFLLA